MTGGYDHQILVWDVDNMVQKLRLQGHLDWVEDVCFSPDQKWILSCGKVIVSTDLAVMSTVAFELKLPIYLNKLCRKYILEFNPKYSLFSLTL